MGSFSKDLMMLSFFVLLLREYVLAGMLDWVVHWCHRVRVSQSQIFRSMHLFCIWLGVVLVHVEV